MNKFITGNKIIFPISWPAFRTFTHRLFTRSFVQWLGYIGSMSSSDSVSVPRAAASTTTTLTAQQLFFTSSGRIGTIVDVPSELSLHLTALERNLRRVVTEITHASHGKYRAPVGTWGKSDADAAAYGFLDQTVVGSAEGAALSIAFSLVFRCLINQKSRAWDFIKVVPIQNFT